MEVHYSDYSLLSFYFLFTISLQGGFGPLAKRGAQKHALKGLKPIPVKKTCLSDADCSLISSAT